MKINHKSLSLGLPTCLGLFLGAVWLWPSQPPSITISDSEAKLSGHVGIAPVKQTKTQIRPAKLVKNGDLPTGAVPVVRKNPFVFGYSLAKLTEGQSISLPLPGEGEHEGSGVIESRLVDAQDGWTRYAGNLADGKGNFILGVRGHEFGGMVRMPSLGKVLLLEPAEAGSSQVKLSQLPLDRWECVGMPTNPGMPEINADEAPEVVTTTPVDKPLAAIPSFDSLPSTKAVIYLDFDGEVVRDSAWNNGRVIRARPATLAGKPVTESDVLSICAVVAEDYAPLKVSVTTSLARYQAAKPGYRIRCIVTPTKRWMPDGGWGVGGISNFWAFARKHPADQSTDIPIWCFDQGTAAVTGLTISHEVGHAFGLKHDGTWQISYYEGQGGWGPIMGAPFGKNLTQWAKGEYDFANNREDDLNILADGSNHVGRRPDDYGNSRKSAFKISSTGFERRGLLSYQADSDWFVLKAKKGPATFSCGSGTTTVLDATSLLGSKEATNSNADVSLQLYGTSGNPIVENAPTDSLSASITYTIPKDGTYYLVVRPSGNADPMKDGYTSYGSLGSYTLRATYTAK